MSANNEELEAAPPPPPGSPPPPPSEPFPPTEPIDTTVIKHGNLGHEDITLNGDVTLSGSKRSYDAAQQSGVDGTAGESVGSGYEAQYGGDAAHTQGYYGDANAWQGYTDASHQGYDASQYGVQDQYGGQGDYAYYEGCFTAYYPAAAPAPPTKRPRLGSFS